MSVGTRNPAQMIQHTVCTHISQYLEQYLLYCFTPQPPSPTRLPHSVYIKCLVPGTSRYFGYLARMELHTLVFVSGHTPIQGLARSSESTINNHAYDDLPVHKMGRLFFFSSFVIFLFFSCFFLLFFFFRAVSASSLPSIPFFFIFSDCVIIFHYFSIFFQPFFCLFSRLFFRFFFFSFPPRIWILLLFVDLFNQNIYIRHLPGSSIYEVHTHLFLNLLLRSNQKRTPSSWSYVACCSREHIKRVQHSAISRA